MNEFARLFQGYRNTDGLDVLEWINKRDVPAGVLFRWSIDGAIIIIIIITATFYNRWVRWFLFLDKNKSAIISTVIAAVVVVVVDVL